MKKKTIITIIASIFFIWILKVFLSLNEDLKKDISIDCEAVRKTIDLSDIDSVLINCNQMLIDDMLFTRVDLEKINYLVFNIAIRRNIKEKSSLIYTKIKDVAHDYISRPGFLFGVRTTTNCTDSIVAFVIDDNIDQHFTTNDSHTLKGNKKISFISKEKVEVLSITFDCNEILCQKLISVTFLENNKHDLTVKIAFTEQKQF